MAFLSLFALCFSVFTGLAKWPWWMATAVGFTAGFIISIWRMSSNTLRDPSSGDVVKSSADGYKVSAINAAGVAAVQTVVHYVAWLFTK